MGDPTEIISNTTTTSTTVGLARRSVKVLPRLQFGYKRKLDLPFPEVADKEVLEKEAELALKEDFARQAYATQKASSLVLISHAFTLVLAYIGDQKEIYKFQNLNRFMYIVAVARVQRSIILAPSEIFGCPSSEVDFKRCLLHYKHGWALPRRIEIPTQDFS